MKGFRRVLITGGLGFIGSHLRREVGKDGESEVVLFDKKIDRLSVLEQVEPSDLVFHLAAKADYKPEYSKYVEDNVLFTARLYEAIAKWDRKPTVVLASSQAVYGMGHSEPGRTLRESDPTLPSSVYGVTKLAQEKLALHLGREMGVPTIACRLSIVLGPYQSPFNLYSGALRCFAVAFKEGRDPVIFQDGCQIRDFTHVLDIVDGLMAAAVAAEERMSGVYNLGSGHGVSVNALAQMVARQYGKTDYKPKPSKLWRSGDARYLVSEIEAAKRDLGFKPRYTLESAVNGYCRWLESIDLQERTETLDDALESMKKAGVLQEIGAGVA